MGVTFKGYNLDNYGVIFEKMPAVKTPAERSESLYVDGRDGFTSQDYGYDGYASNCEIVMHNPTHYAFLKSLLKGVGQLIRNDEPTLYQMAKIKGEIEFERVGIAKKASFDFIIEDPFHYVLNESNVTKTTSPASYTNAGTVESKPLLKLTGSGTVVVTINGVAFTYLFDTPYVYIDCDSSNCTYLGNYKNRQMTGDFPSLAVGVNMITWTGTVTELVITPRTRYL